MKKSALFLSLSLLFPIGVWGQASHPTSIALTHVTVIDMTGAAPMSDMTVIVSGDRIAAVGKSSKMHAAPNTQVIDARGKYLIPGLWDMHTHNFYGPNQSFYSLYIANGVTGVRDMGGLWKYYDAFREKQRNGEPLNGKWPAPRIVAAGVILDGKPPVLKTFDSASNPEEARRAVDLRKQRGVDFVKVYSMLNRGEYFAIADEAKKDGLPYAGHVTSWVSAAEASDAGQKSIEHANGIFLACSTKESQIRAEILKTVADKGYSFAVYERADYLPIDSYSKRKAAALFARFVKNGTYVTPTLVVEKPSPFVHDGAEVIRLSNLYMPQVANWWKQEEKHFTEFPDPKDTAGMKKIYSSFFVLTEAMNRAGVPLLAGTDTDEPYVVPGFSLHEELELFVQAGLTPMQALQTATVNPARYLGMENELGTVEKGKLADLALLDANPLADIHNAAKIDAVFADGRYLPKADLQEMLAEVAAANAKRAPVQ